MSKPKLCFWVISEAKESFTEDEHVCNVEGLLEVPRIGEIVRFRKLPGFRSFTVVSVEWVIIGTPHANAGECVRITEATSYAHIRIREIKRAKKKKVTE